MVYFLILIISIHVFLVQNLLTINPDVGFLYQIAKNSNFTNIYENYYEINPPLIIYLYKIILYIFSFTRVDDIFSLRLGMLIYIFIGIHLVGSNILSSFLNLNHTYSIILSFSIGMLLVNPTDFLQREQFILVGIFVYISNCISYLKKGNLNYIDRIITILFVSISICLKPQYIVVVFFIESYFLFSFKSIKSLFRPEILGVVFFGLVYVLFVVFYLKEYFHIVYPLAIFGYVSYFVEFKYLITVFSIILLYSFFPLFILLKNKFDVQVLILITLSVFSTGIAFLIGRTGFTYHLINMLGIYNALLMLSLFILISNINNGGKDFLIFFSVILLLFSISIKFGMVNTIGINYTSSVNILENNSRKLSKDNIVDENILNLYNEISSTIKKMIRSFFCLVQCLQLIF